MVRPLLATTSSIGIAAVDGSYFATTAFGAREIQFSRSTTECLCFKPSIPWLKHSSLRQTTCPYSTDPRENPASATLDNGLAEEQDLLHASVEEVKNAEHENKAIVRQIELAEEVKNAESDTKVIVRRIESDLVQEGRIRSAKLAKHKKDKSYWQQRHHDRFMSWSYDWREPLKDLEEASVLGLNNLTPAPSFPLDRRIHNVRADQIIRSVRWTRPALDRYVYRLTTSTMDRLVARKLYSGGVRHLDAVADTLEDLFFNDELKYVLTSTAASMTLNFFFSNGKFARGREIFGQLQKLQKALHPSTFNIMLKAAAEQQNLFNFTYILKLMINCGVHPNVHTWLYLAQATRNEEVRQLIIDRMNQKGYLKEFSVTPDAAALVIPQLAGKYMNSGEDPQRLIELLDQRFGSDWHHGRASERVIDEVGVRQSTERALSVLQTLEGRGYHPSQGLLMLLLRQCSWYRDHELAIRLLRKFRLEYRIFPAESRICDVLFSQAWRSRLHNCCRVIWTYACIRGCTSYDMQEKVKKSVCSERSETSAKKSRSVMWEEGAGHVITSRVGRISLHRLKRLMLMWQPAEPGKDRAASDEYLRVMRRLVNQDLEDVGKFTIRTPLDELLAEALFKDQLWAADRVMKTVPLECRYSQIYYPFRSIVKVGQPWREVIPRPLFSSQEERRNPGYRMTPEKRDPESSGCCWMSARTRLRACICPEYIKKQPSNLQASDGEQESQARAEEAEEEAGGKVVPLAGVME